VVQRWLNNGRRIFIVPEMRPGACSDLAQGDVDLHTVRVGFPHKDDALWLVDGRCPGVPITAAAHTDSFIKTPDGAHNFFISPVYPGDIYLTVSTITMMEDIMLNKVRTNKVIFTFLAAFLALAIGALWTGTSEAAVEIGGTTGVLSAAESSDLAFMREEEKVARDLYLAFYDIYGAPVFSNIAVSEQRHMDTVLALMENYGLADPVADNGRGVFNDPELAALYDQLLADGSVSLAEALRVAAAVEEIDILDLQDSLANTNKLDIITAYQNLLDGSVNHLRAYSAQWEGQTGQVYTPQAMDDDQFAELMNLDASQGQGGGGFGRRGW
jgi:hypothetical protein